MRITEKIKLNLLRYKISNDCFHTRIRRGWDVIAAQTTPVEVHGYDYEVLMPDARMGKTKTFRGTSAVAEFLSQKTHTNVTKNTIVGQIYRKGFAKVGKFMVRPK